MLIRCRDTLDLSRTSQTAASGGLHPQRTCLSLINALSFYAPLRHLFGLDFFAESSLPLSMMS